MSSAENTAGEYKAVVDMLAEKRREYERLQGEIRQLLGIRDSLGQTLAAMVDGKNPRKVLAAGDGDVLIVSFGRTTEIELFRAESTDEPAGSEPAL